MQTSPDDRMQDLILRELYTSPNREAILVPQMFTPPIMLSHIFRLGLKLKGMGYTTGPDRRMGGWHLKLLPPGIEYCQTNK